MKLLMDMTVKDEIEQDILRLEREIQVIEKKIDETDESNEENVALLTILNIQAHNRTLAYLDCKIKLERLVG